MCVSLAEESTCPTEMMSSLNVSWSILRCSVTINRIEYPEMLTVSQIVNKYTILHGNLRYFCRVDKNLQ
jgi:hypothetical protein